MPLKQTHIPKRLDAIPLIVPEIAGNEWHYVKECLDTNWVSTVGEYVNRFEKLVAERAGAKYGVATVNGTAALHVALLLAGVERDDEVLVSSLSFIAPANAIRYTGAWPVFIDAEAQYWQMDPEKVVEFLEQNCRWDGNFLRNRNTGRRVKAIMPVHILGNSVDLDPILTAAEKYNLSVIEDATEGLGAKYRGRSLGGIGHIGCFSFNGNKIITTGGGGMLVTNNELWAKKAKHLTTQAKDDPIEYIHREIGYNYRLPNLLAAMGCAQMEKLDDYVAAKRRIAARYREAFTGLNWLCLPEEADWAFSTYWMYTVLIDREEAGFDSRQLLKRLASQQIQTRPLWQPLHNSRAHETCHNGAFPVSEKLYAQALSLPCSVGLAKTDQDAVIQAVSYGVYGN